MSVKSESVHVHRTDEALIVEEFRQKGYVLKERAKPSMIAQRGFIKLIFIPTEQPAEMSEENDRPYVA